VKLRCTTYCIWSVISSISNLNGWSDALGLFYHVPLKRDLEDRSQRIVTHCNRLQHTATHCTILQHRVSMDGRLDIYAQQKGATYCNTLQHRVSTIRQFHTLQHKNVIYRKRATNYRALLQMTLKHAASYGSSPPCKCVSKCDYKKIIPHMYIIMFTDTTTRFFFEYIYNNIFSFFFLGRCTAS